MKRHSFVWTIYLLLGLFSFMLSMVGPMVPFLREEFHLDYTLAGLHQSAFALGMVVMGLFADGILRRFGLARSLWVGFAGMAVCLLGVVTAPGPALTLPAILLMSLSGTLALAALQTAMGTGFGDFRSKVILEANLCASAFSMSVPLVLLVGASWGLGWRIVFPFVLVVLTLVAAFGLPATKRHAASLAVPPVQHGGKLGRAYWMMWLVLFFGVSVEWAIGFWCMTYLLTLPGHSLELASWGTVLLGLSAVAGRFVTSRISHRFREETLLVVALVIIAVGFLPYWSLASVPVAFAGLFLCGYGASTLFPLAFSLTVAKAPGNPSQAASLAPVAAGLGIGLAPLLLGRLADWLDMKAALWYIPLGLVIIAGLLFVAVVPGSKGPLRGRKVAKAADAPHDGDHGAEH